MFNCIKYRLVFCSGLPSSTAASNISWDSLTLAGAVMGSVLFRLLVAIALRWGLDPNDLKLITALFVFAALVLPSLLKKLDRKPALTGAAGSVTHA